MDNPDTSTKSMNRLRRIFNIVFVVLVSAFLGKILSNNLGLAAGWSVLLFATLGAILGFAFPWNWLQSNLYLAYYLYHLCDFRKCCFWSDFE